MPGSEQKYPEFYAALNTAMESDTVLRVMEEYAGNMGFKLDGLPRYGLGKVARYVAIVTHCELCGISLDDFRLTPEEANRKMLKIAKLLQQAGKPTIVTDGDTVQMTEPLEEPDAAEQS